MLFKGGKGHPRKTCLFLSQETGKEVGLTLSNVKLGRRAGIQLLGTGWALKGSKGFQVWECCWVPGHQRAGSGPGY